MSANASAIFFRRSDFFSKHQSNQKCYIDLWWHDAALDDISLKKISNIWPERLRKSGFTTFLKYLDKYHHHLSNIRSLSTYNYLASKTLALYVIRQIRDSTNMYLISTRIIILKSYHPPSNSIIPCNRCIFILYCYSNDLFV